MGQRLGQHFLANQAVLNRIALSACSGREPLVIEIGAGRGALTAHLLEYAEKVVAIETDPMLAERLEDRFRDRAGFTLLHSDVLRTDLGQWGPGVVAGNLPYYITSPILSKVLGLGPLLRRAVFLVQKEVAERLAAAPGSRGYGFLTVRTQFFATAEILFTVSPAAFRPPPQVDSAVVRLQMRPPGDRWGVDTPEPFLEFVSLCFRQKRKTIRNNLLGGYPKLALDGCPETSRRAEQLSMEELVELHRRLAAAGGQ